MVAPGVFYYSTIISNSISIACTGCLILYNFLRKDAETRRKVAHRLITLDLLAVFLLSLFFLIENLGYISTSSCQVINVFTTFFRNGTACIASCICHMLVVIVNGRRPELRTLKKYLIFSFILSIIPTIIFAAVVAPNIIKEYDFGGYHCVYRQSKTIIVTAVILTVLIPGILCLLCICAFLYNRHKLNRLRKEGVVSEVNLGRIYIATRILYGYPLIFILVTLFTVIYYIDYENEVLGVIFSIITGLQGTFIFLTYVLLARHPSAIVNFSQTRSIGTISRLTGFFRRLSRTSNDSDALFYETPQSSRTESLISDSRNSSVLSSPVDLDRRYSRNFNLNDTITTVTTNSLNREINDNTLL